MVIIEHELVIQGGEDEAPMCPICGYLCEWMECEECDGEGGWYPHEMSPIEYPDPDEMSPCQICNGTGGWWRCPNPPAWCKGNPKEVEREATELPVATPPDYVACGWCGRIVPKADTSLIPWPDNANMVRVCDDCCDEEGA